jgi:DNA helicase-2/ATP-dependent DNA helicase PcrA
VSDQGRSPTGATFVPADLPRLLGVPLSHEQLHAATAPLAPQLIVAGAGTGKTTVMAARVAWLVATGQVPPSGVLGLTFTNKAAGELRSRIRRVLLKIAARGADTRTPDAAVSGDIPEPTVMTYHSFAGRLVNEHGLLLGIEPTSATLTDALRARLAYGVACEPIVSLAEIPVLARGTPASLAEKLLLLDDALADLDVDTEEMREFDHEILAQIAAHPGTPSLISRVGATASGRVALSHLVDQFRARKSDEGRQDFADQVRHCSALARGVPEIAAAIQSQYPVVLLDEYQDTSRSQRRMMQSLCGSGHAVTAVGDPCQAIYGWRGASVTNIDRFPEQFPSSAGEPARVYSLSVNRRSTDGVLSVANRVSTDLRGVHSHMKPLQSASDAETGKVTCALLETQDDEVEWIVDRVDMLCQRRQPGDVSILCRTNDQIATVAAALVERGLPVHVAAKQALLLMPQVQEVASIMRLLVDPYANPSLLSLLTGPRCRIGPRDLSLLGQQARQLATDGSVDTPTDAPDVSLMDAVVTPGPAEYSREARERLAEVAGLLARLRSLRGRPVVEIAESVVETLGIPTMWVSGPGSDGDAAVMGDFFRLAREYEGLDGGRSLADFISYVDDCERFEAQPGVERASGDDRVTLMTVHGAKGLEFQVVVLPFVSDGVFPSKRGRSRWPTSASTVPQSLEDDADSGRSWEFPHGGVTTKSHNEFLDVARVSERLDEDRLAYVAITRAEDELIMSGHWWGPTQAKPRGPAVYLEAAKSVCEEQGWEVDQWTPAPDPDAVSPCLVTPAEAVMWPVPSVSVQARSIRDAFSEFDGSEFGETAEDAHPGVARVPRAEVVDLADNGLEWGSDPGSCLDASDWELRVDRVLNHLDYSPTPVSLPEMLSASQVVDWRKDPVAFGERLARPMPRPVSPAASAGTAFHEWIEQQLGQQALFDFDDTGEVLEPSPAASQQHLREMFKSTPFADRTPVAVERPFTVQIGGLVVTGQIDAVFANDSGFEIVDWKTGSGQRSDPYQLALYKHAWCEIAGVQASSVSTAFVFLSTGEVVWHNDLPDVATQPLPMGLAFET